MLSDYCYHIKVVEKGDILHFAKYIYFAPKMKKYAFSKSTLALFWLPKECKTSFPTKIIARIIAQRDRKQYGSKGLEYSISQGDAREIVRQRRLQRSKICNMS